MERDVQGLSLFDQIRPKIIQYILAHMNGCDLEMGRPTRGPPGDTSKERTPQGGVARAEVKDVDDPLIGHGMEYGVVDHGMGEAQVWEGAGEGEPRGSGRVGVGFVALSGPVERGVEARPAFDEAGGERGGEAGGEALHGVAGDGGEVGDLAEASVGTVEVAGGGVGCACQEELDEVKASVFRL